MLLSLFTMRRCYPFVCIRREWNIIYVTLSEIIWNKIIIFKEVLGTFLSYFLFFHCGCEVFNCYLDYYIFYCNYHRSSLFVPFTMNTLQFKKSLVHCFKIVKLLYHLQEKHLNKCSWEI